MALRVLIVFSLGFIIGTLENRLTTFPLGIFGYLATVVCLGICLLLALGLVLARVERRV